MRQLPVSWLLSRNVFRFLCLSYRQQPPTGTKTYPFFHIYIERPLSPLLFIKRTVWVSISNHISEDLKTVQNSSHRLYATTKQLSETDGGFGERKECEKGGGDICSNELSRSGNARLYTVKWRYRRRRHRRHFYCLGGLSSQMRYGNQGA